MVEPPHAEEHIETILSSEIAGPPGSERATKDNRTVSTLLNLLGKKHTVAVLYQYVMGDGPLRFSNLEDAVDIAPNTHSNRLEKLTGIGLCTWTSYTEIPPRIEFEAAEKARELTPVFWHLGVSTEDHDLEPIR